VVGVGVAAGAAATGATIGRLHPPPSLGALQLTCLGSLRQMQLFTFQKQETMMTVWGQQRGHRAL
jgi:hypothetical protein